MQWLSVSSSVAWCFRGGFFNRCVLILSLQAVFFQAVLLSYYSVSDIISLFYWNEYYSVVRPEIASYLLIAGSQSSVAS